MNWFPQFLKRSANENLRSQPVQVLKYEARVDKLMPVEAVAEMVPDSASQLDTQTETGAPLLRTSSLIRDHERFAAVFIKEINSIGRAHVSLRTAHDKLVRQQASLTSENRRIEQVALLAQSNNKVLSDENSKLRLDNGTLERKVEVLNTEVFALRDRNQALEQRNQSLETDFATVLAERDSSEASLISLQAELKEASEGLAVKSARIDALRDSLSESEAQRNLLSVSLEEAKLQLAPATRQAVDQSVRIADLENQVAELRQSLAEVSRAATEERSVREELAHRLAQGSTKYDEDRREFGAKIDALSKTKTFLWRMTEKQRRVLADQVTTISQLESSNSKLSHAFLDRGADAETAGEAPIHAGPGPAAKLKVASSS